jgi:hypothetical protein
MPSFVRSAVFAALLSFSLLMPAAFAREVTAEERTALAETVASFDAAMRANDLETVLKTVPPQVMSYVAVRSGVTEVELKAAMLVQMEAALENAGIESFQMDLDSAEHRELPDGTPYVVIPTVTILDLGETGKVSARSPTLGLIKDGVWYLMRIADQEQVKLLTGAFPEFAGEQFPPGTMEPITE